MENSTLRDCLSYDSTLNYFLWSSEVDSLKILVSEILKNTAIALAEVNEDMHHKMLSFKAADCTIKLYTTTKKMWIWKKQFPRLTTRGLKWERLNRPWEKACCELNLVPSVNSFFNMAAPPYWKSRRLFVQVFAKYTLKTRSEESPHLQRSYFLSTPPSGHVKLVREG